MKTKKTAWIKEIAKDGYKYIVKDKNGEIWTSKARMKKNGDFADNSVWRQVELFQGEEWPLKYEACKFYNIAEVN